MSFGAEPDIKAYADGLALNPARTPPGAEGLDEVWAAPRTAFGTGRLAELATAVG